MVPACITRTVDFFFLSNGFSHYEGRFSFFLIAIPKLCSEVAAEASSRLRAPEAHTGGGRRGAGGERAAVGPGRARPGSRPSAPPWTTPRLPLREPRPGAKRGLPTAAASSGAYGHAALGPGYPHGTPQPATRSLSRRPRGPILGGPGPTLPGPCGARGDTGPCSAERPRQGRGLRQTVSCTALPTPHLSSSGSSSMAAPALPPLRPGSSGEGQRHTQLAARPRAERNGGAGAEDGEDPGGEEPGRCELSRRHTPPGTCVHRWSRPSPCPPPRRESGSHSRPSDLLPVVCRRGPSEASAPAAGALRTPPGERDMGRSPLARSWLSGGGREQAGSAAVPGRWGWDCRLPSAAESPEVHPPSKATGRCRGGRAQVAGQGRAAPRPAPPPPRPRPHPLPSPPAPRRELLSGEWRGHPGLGLRRGPPRHRSHRLRRASPPGPAPRAAAGVAERGCHLSRAAARGGGWRREHRPGSARRSRAPPSAARSLPPARRSGRAQPASLRGAAAAAEESAARSWRR